MDVAGILRLNIRRRIPGQVYVDCPICGDRRGKMNLNLSKDTWRCNYCGTGGGMLALYARVYGVSNAVAYQEICDALAVGTISSAYTAERSNTSVPDVQESELASPQEIHRTFSALLSMLTLTAAHRRHLNEVRGLSDEQIDRFRLRSTPPPSLCRPLTDRLRKAGYTVQGVPGFYLDDSGRWTVKFYRRTSGIIIPIVSAEGLIHGLQVRLDHPIRDKDDPPEKEGIKYLTLSSAGKSMGVSSGSPIHFVGDTYSRIVYVTEGCLKADIAHALSNRTFAATIGANNVAKLDDLLAFLSKNGTKEIIEAQDMDKYRNNAVDAGSSKIAMLARKHGLECRRLTWNPNHKGIDDWLLALRKKSENERIKRTMNFKEQYLHGRCEFGSLQTYINQWEAQGSAPDGLAEFLGLTPQEYQAFFRSESELHALLDRQRHHQHFRIYQLDLDGGRVIPFAFSGLDALHKAGYDQPPATEYQLIYDGVIICPNRDSQQEILKEIFDHYNDTLPADYAGRSVSPSDVLELYGDTYRKYFYCDTSGFSPVKFSPLLVRKPERPQIDGERLLRALNALSESIRVPNLYLNDPENGKPHMADVTLLRENSPDQYWQIAFDGSCHEDAYGAFINALNDKLEAQAKSFQSLQVIPKAAGLQQYEVCAICGGHRLYLLEFRSDYAPPRLYEPVNQGTPEISQSDVPYRISGTYCMDCHNFCETRHRIGTLEPILSDDA